MIQVGALPEGKHDKAYKKKVCMSDPAENRGEKNKKKSRVKISKIAGENP